MFRESVLLVFLSVAAVADTSNQCIQFYRNREGKLAARTEEKTKKVKSRLTKEQAERVEKIYLPMFRDAFETEFSVRLIPEYVEMFRKLMFDPESITMEERQNWFGNGTNNLLISYLGLNHITVENQENRAENLLTKLRSNELPKDRKGKPLRVELSQLELVALRVSRIIGRDFDLFEGTKYAVSEKEIIEMKKRFLNLFTFSEKSLSESEFQAFYEKNLVKDDVMGEERYDLAQVYNPEYVTKEMISARNHRRLQQTMEWKSSFNDANQKLLDTDPAYRAAYEGLRSRMAKDPGLMESIKHVRLALGRKIGKPDGISSREELSEWIDKENAFYKQGLEKLDGKGVDKKIEYLTAGMTPTTSHKEQLRRAEARLSDLVAKRKISATEKQDMLAFLNSELGKRLFQIAREELKHMKLELFGLIQPKVSARAMKRAFEKQLDLLEEITALKKESNILLDVVYRFKMVRTKLTWEEVNEIYNILTYDSKLRPLNLAEFDPTSKFGFCFGRAFFANLILQHHGVHKDSIKKVFVYGPMSGGLFGWGFHVATMVAREDGGFWVIDPTHGKPETLQDWFAHYEVASKDGRIKMDVSEGERFGRNFWGTPDMNNLNDNYGSIWNKIIGSNIQYFKDNMQHLDKNNFDRERNVGPFKYLFDKILDAADLGY